MPRPKPDWLYGTEKKAEFKPEKYSIELERLATILLKDENADKHKVDWFLSKIEGIIIQTIYAKENERLSPSLKQESQAAKNFVKDARGLRDKLNGYSSGLILNLSNAIQKSPNKCEVFVSDEAPNASRPYYLSDLKNILDALIECCDDYDQKHLKNSTGWKQFTPENSLVFDVYTMFDILNLKATNYMNKECGSNSIFMDVLTCCFNEVAINIENNDRFERFKTPSREKLFSLAKSSKNQLKKIKSKYQFDEWVSKRYGTSPFPKPI